MFRLTIYLVGYQRYERARKLAASSQGMWLGEAATPTAGHFGRESLIEVKTQGSKDCLACPHHKVVVLEFLQQSGELQHSQILYFLCVHLMFCVHRILMVLWYAGGRGEGREGRWHGDHPIAARATNGGNTVMMMRLPTWIPWA